MIDTSKLTDEELRRRAWDAIIREVGVVGFVRVMRHFVPPMGNWLEDKEKVLPKFEDMDALFAAVEEHAKERRRVGQV